LFFRTVAGLLREKQQAAQLLQHQATQLQGALAEVVSLRALAESKEPAMREAAIEAQHVATAMVSLKAELAEARGRVEELRRDADSRPTADVMERLVEVCEENARLAEALQEEREAAAAAATEAEGHRRAALALRRENDLLAKELEEAKAAEQKISGALALTSMEEHTAAAAVTATAGETSAWSDARGGSWAATPSASLDPGSLAEIEALRAANTALQDEAARSADESIRARSELLQLQREAASLHTQLNQVIAGLSGGSRGGEAMITTAAIGALAPLRWTSGTSSTPLGPGIAGGARPPTPPSPPKAPGAASRALVGRTSGSSDAAVDLVVDLRRAMAALQDDAPAASRADARSQSGAVEEMGDEVVVALARLADDVEALRAHNSRLQKELDGLPGSTAS
jgi:hypothetical protein